MKARNSTPLRGKWGARKCVEQAIRSKRWSTGLLVFSEVFFLAASLCLAMSLG